MGRPPKPTDAHLRDGTYKESRHGNRVPDSDFPAATDLQCPDDLSGHASEAWLRIIEVLPKDRLKQADVELLAGMCHWLGEFAKVRESLRGLEVTSQNYYKLTILAQMTWKAFKDCAGAFGMTPADRARLKFVVEQKTEEDGLEILGMLKAS